MSIQNDQRQGVRKLIHIGLGVVFIAGGVVASLEVLSVVRAAKPRSPALFDHGLSTPDFAAPAKWTNQWCGSCHKDDYRAWKESRHAKSGIADNFVVEFLDHRHGRRQFCINCHTPTNPSDRKLGTHKPAGVDDAFETRQPWVENGVGCLTCHVRDGHVLATRVTDEAKKHHPTRLAPELATTEFCAGCHQFGFKENDLSDSFRGALQQASFEEFLDYRKAGGDVDRCHDCHMLDGDHSMPGGYSSEMLTQAADVGIETRWRDDVRMLELTVTVSAGHVGHRVPGGEHFRFLSFETSVTDSNGKAILLDLSNRATGKSDGAIVVRRLPHIVPMRRRLGDYESEVDLQAEPIPDQRLKPGEDRRHKFLIPVDRRYANQTLVATAHLRYHLMGEEKARMFHHTDDDVIRTVTTATEEVTVSPAE